MKNLLLLLLLVSPMACADDLARSVSPSEGSEAYQTQQALIGDPVINAIDPGLDTITGRIWDPSEFREVAGAPYPGSKGMYLGDAISANFCYADYNPLITDLDHDWLDDTCERHLAQAFSPAVNLHYLEKCGGGEPYWAAQYFPNYPGVSPLSQVRIAYMPAYYRDCGTGGHSGDSEFIMVEVWYDHFTRQWQFRRMYLSAHACALPCVNESSFYASHQVEFPSGRDLSYPKVYISKNKHANYATLESCNSALIDVCGPGEDGQIRVYKTRNVGSRWADFFPECVAATVPPHNSTGRLECFYSSRAFRGWQNEGIHGPTPYYEFLSSETFGCHNETPGLGACYLGPGPSPAALVTLNTFIQGKTFLGRTEIWTWTASTRGGSPPYECSYSRTEVATQTASVVVPRGSTCAYTGKLGNLQGFDLRVTVWDSGNNAVTSFPYQIRLGDGGGSGA